MCLLHTHTHTHRIPLSHIHPSTPQTRKSMRWLTRAITHNSSCTTLRCRYTRIRHMQHPISNKTFLRGQPTPKYMTLRVHCFFQTSWLETIMHWRALNHKTTKSREYIIVTVAAKLYLAPSNVEEEMERHRVVLRTASRILLPSGDRCMQTLAHARAWQT